MITVNAIYRNGKFQPISPVDLPEESLVTLKIEPMDIGEECSSEDCIFEMPDRSEDTRQTDMAQRYNDN